MLELVKRMNEPVLSQVHDLARWTLETQIKLILLLLRTDFAQVGFEIPAWQLTLVHEMEFMNCLKIAALEDYLKELFRGCISIVLSLSLIFLNEILIYWTPIDHLRPDLLNDLEHVFASGVLDLMIMAPNDIILNHVFQIVDFILDLSDNVTDQII